MHDHTSKLAAQITEKVSCKEYFSIIADHSMNRVYMCVYYHRSVIQSVTQSIHTFGFCSGELHQVSESRLVLSQ